RLDKAWNRAGLVGEIAESGWSWRPGRTSGWGHGCRSSGRRDGGRGGRILGPFEGRRSGGGGPPYVSHPRPAREADRSPGAAAGGVLVTRNRSAVADRTTSRSSRRA